VVSSAHVKTEGQIVGYGTTPQDLEAGSPANIWVKIYNPGYTTSTYQLSVKIRYDNISKYAVTDVVADLAPLATTTWTMSQQWTPDANGLHAFLVVLENSDGSVGLDSDSTTFDVPGVLTYQNPYRPYINDVIYDVGVVVENKTVEPGNYVTAKIIVDNQLAPFQDISLSWWIEDSNGNKIDEGSSPVAIRTGESITWTKNLYIYPETPVGSYKFWAKIVHDGEEKKAYDTFGVVAPQSQFQSKSSTSESSGGSSNNSISGGGGAGGGGAGGGGGLTLGGEETKTVSKKITSKKTLSARANGTDINGDGKVNLVDFSILLYNWGRPKISKVDLNGDNVVDLRDFSIMLYWWTG
jgi:uncharacterized membrane protein YgcG